MRQMLLSEGGDMASDQRCGCSLQVLAQGCQVGRCVKSAAIWGTPDALPTWLQWQPLTRSRHSAKSRRQAERLAIIGSWRDALGDDEILIHLCEYNAGRPIIHRPQ